MSSCQVRSSRCFFTDWLLFRTDTQIKPLLNFSDVQSRSVRLHWTVADTQLDRFNHFIIYYRCLPKLDQDDRVYDELIDMQEYRQILVDPRTAESNAAFEVLQVQDERGPVATNFASRLDTGSDSVHHV